MEDNDPSGYKSKAAVKCKAENRMEVFALPRRSPELNPLDYTVWAEINKRMRKQEASWPQGKRETRAEFLKRLRRIAMNLPSDFINNAFGDLEKRCAQLKKAKGGHFVEGR